MLFIIDRMEGMVAVCEREDESFCQIPLQQLPQGVREGDCLRRQQDGSYQLDPLETARRRQAAADLLKKLLKE